MNHVNIFWWLGNTTTITQSKDKTFFSLADDQRNDLTIYDDDDEQLFNVFVEIIPKKIHPKALKVVRHCVGTGEGMEHSVTASKKDVM